MQNTVQSVLEHERSTTGGKALEVPCQNTFKDKPAFMEFMGGSQAFPNYLICLVHGIENLGMGGTEDG